MNIREEVAHGTAVVGYNLLTGHELERVQFPRVIVGVAYVGSAAAGDTCVDLFVGTTKVFTIANSRTGLGINKDDVLAMSARVPSGQLIQAVVNDAAVTNNVAIHINMVP